MNIKKYKKKINKIYFFIIITIIIISINLIILSFTNKVYGEENAEVQTSKIIQSQSETLRNIKFYRRSGKIPKWRL